MQRMTKSWVLRYFVFEEDGYRQAIDNKKAESKQYGPEFKKRESERSPSVHLKAGDGFCIYKSSVSFTLN